MLMEECGHHLADRNDVFAVRAGGLERFLYQDGRQAASAEPVVDLGVVENSLVIPVGDSGEADRLAINGDGVFTVLGANCGVGTGLVGGQLSSLPCGLSGTGVVGTELSVVTVQVAARECPGYPCSSVRQTRIALGPPKGTFGGRSTSGPSSCEAVRATSAGAVSRLLIVHPFARAAIRRRHRHSTRTVT
jgi:hypothetical protein